MAYEQAKIKQNFKQSAQSHYKLIPFYNWKPNRDAITLGDKEFPPGKIFK